MSLYSETLKLIRRRALLDGVRTLVVGLSGGPDSVCLFDLLALMIERGDAGFALHAAHLNHGLRGAESDGDAAFVAELAATRGVPITLERRDVSAARVREGGSLEEAARRERYEFLASAAARVGAEAVAVGHNADDQAETVLHRLIRGTGLRGLRGMALTRPLAPVSAAMGQLREGSQGTGTRFAFVDTGGQSRTSPNPHEIDPLRSPVRLIRPLLHARRSEILAHLRERGLAFREDSSNRDTAFLRNRIRTELLPLIESGYNPAFGESLVRLSRSAADAYDLLSRAGDEAARECVSGGAIDLGKFAQTPDALRPFVIDRAVASVAPDAPQFDAVHYEALIELALSGAPNAELDLPGGIVAVRSRDAVTFTAGGLGEPAPAFAVPLAVPGATPVPAAALTVIARLYDRPEFDLDAFLRAKTCYDEVMDYEAMGGPLVLRSWRPGDAFWPLGAAGTKKVGDFLTDRKTPADERGRVLIVEAAGRPVWVVGHRIDERVKVTAPTARLLRLSVERMEQTTDL